MLDLIIKGGQVVTPQGADVMDVGVQGDKIVAVGWPGTLAADAARVIDATGKIVVPGGIEPHAHIGIPGARALGGHARRLHAATGGGEPRRRVRRRHHRHRLRGHAGARSREGRAAGVDPRRARDAAFDVPRPQLYRLRLPLHPGRRGPCRHRRPDRRGHPGGRGELQDLHHVPADPRAVRSPVEHLRRGGQARRHHGGARGGRRRRHVHDGKAQGRGPGAGL